MRRRGVEAVMIVACLLLAATASAAAVRELAVSEPRAFVTKAQRVDGALSSDGKTPIAAWTAARTRDAILASRVTRSREAADPYAIRFPLSAGWVHHADVATMGDSGVAALEILGSDANSMGRIAVARLNVDGTVIDGGVRYLGAGLNPAVATNGRTFAVAYSRLDGQVEVQLLSPQLDVLDTARFAGQDVRIAASGGAYLCLFNTTSGYTTKTRAVPIVGNSITPEPYDVATVSTGSSPGALTAYRSGWAAALVTDTIEVCELGISRAACRKVSGPEPSPHVADVAPAGDVLVVAWYSEAGRYPADPPLPYYRARLTRVTPYRAEELSAEPLAAPADDDIILIRDEGDAMRVGRNGAVALVPFRLTLREQRVHGLYPTGDGATAIWSEVAASGDRSELHATRFTGSGIDPRIHDRVLGDALVLGSDGLHLLMSDGRLVGPDGEAAGTVSIPKNATQAGWDGSRWVFIADGAVVRGTESVKFGAGNSELACTDHACLLVWLSETYGNRLVIDAHAMYIAADRQLRWAKNQLLAADIVEYQVRGAAAAGETLMAFWSDGRARNVQGRAFDARGRMSRPFVVARPVQDRDPLFFHAGGGGGEALIGQHGLPMQRLVRVRPDGGVIGTTLFDNGTPRGLVRVGGKTLILVDRMAAAPPLVPAWRAFVLIAP